MKPTTAFVSLLLATDIALAADLSTLSRALQHVHGPVLVLAPSRPFARQAALEPKVKKSLNWAGAVVASDRGSVKGTITVPAPEIPSDSTTPADVHCATFWTGVDGVGATCQSILQTGIDVCAQRTSNGTLDTLARSWHQFFPGKRATYQLPVMLDSGHTDVISDGGQVLILAHLSVPAALHDIQISFGDVVSMSVTATGRTSGVVLVENETTGSSASHTYANVSDASLCLETAEFVVERFTADAASKALIPFADFGNVTFDNATVGGAAIQGMDITMFEMTTNTSTLATCDVDGSSVVCSDR